MKIVIDARLYGLENAGLGRYVMSLIESLQSVDERNEYSVLLRKKYYQSLNLGKNWKKVLVDFRHYSINEQLKLPDIIKREKPDIVHFPHFNVPYGYKGKYVVTIHDMIMHRSKGLETTTNNLFSYYFKRAIYRLVFKNALNSTEIIIVPTKAIKKELMDNFDIDKGRIEVTYEGYNSVFENPNINKSVLKKLGINNKYFIYMGNAYPHKNLKVAIEAIKSLNKVSKEKIYFVIVTSKGMFKERLEKEAELIGASNSVKILDYQTDEDLAVLLNESQGLIYPSLMEGFGLQGIEAMAAGTLVIASDIPVFREVYSDLAFYFDPEKVSELVRQMKKILKLKKGDRENIVEKQKSLIKSYSWDKMARKTLKIYESCNSI